ncbi:TPA: hypothetical protein NV714_000044 [Escherichia coli]|jgi:hypothetical protein|nr:hypothetical protein [Escherichia coli]
MFQNDICDSKYMSTNVSYKKILETELKERQLAKKGFLNVSHWPIKKGYSLNELMNMSEDLMDLLNENEVYYKGISINTDNNDNLLFYVHLNRAARTMSELEDIPETFLGYKVISIKEGKFIVV